MCNHSESSGIANAFTRLHGSTRDKPSTGRRRLQQYPLPLRSPQEALVFAGLCRLSSPTRPSQVARSFCRLWCCGRLADDAATCFLLKAGRHSKLTTTVDVGIPDDIHARSKGHESRAGQFTQVSDFIKREILLRIPDWRYTMPQEFCSMTLQPWILCLHRFTELEKP